MSKQALEGTRSNAFWIEADKLTIVGLDTDDGPSHPLYDERVKLPVDENFARLMIRQGFRSTITVRKNGPLVEVVAGRQRVKTARRANEIIASEKLDRAPIKVLCSTERCSDEEAHEYGLTENTYRQDDSPITTSNKVRRFLEAGNSEKDTALVFNCTVQHVRDMMKLHDLDSSVRKAVERGELTASAAAPLVELTRDDQKTALEGLLTERATGGEKVTARVVKGATARHKASARGAAADEVVVAPPKRLVTKVLKLNKKADVLPADFVRGVLWVMGELQSKRVGGLLDLEREASAKQRGGGVKAVSALRDHNN